jgi:hypothetical protein
VVCYGNRLLSKNIWNNKQFKVHAYNNETIQLKTEDNKIQEITLDEFFKNFEKAYAITVHKSQGKTIDEPIIIYLDTIWDKRTLYTALTRARSLSQITIYNPKNQTTFTNKPPPPIKTYWETKGPLFGYIYKFEVLDGLYIGSTKAKEFDDCERAHQSNYPGVKLTKIREIYCADDFELRLAEFAFIKKFSDLGFKMLDEHGVVERNKTLADIKPHVFQKIQTKLLGSIITTSNPIIFKYMHN